MTKNHWFWNSKIVYKFHQGLLNLSSWIWKKQSGR